MQKRAYRSTAVQDVKISEVIARLAEGPVWVGMDVAKKEVLVVLRDNAGVYSRPWKVRQPTDLGLLVDLLLELSKRGPVITAMESTGTYGDALRQSLTDAGLEVRLVSSLATSKYAETFDGVPSNHDGKDAAVVAELAAIGKSKPWSWCDPNAWERKVECLVEWMDSQQDILQIWIGRLESVLARHWPEVLSLLKLNSATLLKLLAKYGGPAALAKDPAAAATLARWGGPLLIPEKIEAVVAAARDTVGVRMSPEKILALQTYARQAIQARKEICRAKSNLVKLAHENEVVMKMAQVVAPVTACVLWSAIGDPRAYHCGHAYLKAFGLNLKERSSGKHKGKLKITKRGPSRGRRWLFFSSLRVVQQQPVKAWYLAKKHKDKNQALCGLVAVMRKLVLAIHAVTVGSEPFSLERLFPGRPGKSRPKSTQAAQGALPPDPRNLSPSCRTRKGKSRVVTKGSPPPDLSTSATGSALGSVSTGALSSAQSKKQIARKR